MSFLDDESLYLYYLSLQRRLGLLKRSVSSIPIPYLRANHGTYDLRLVKIIELFRPSATKVYICPMYVELPNSSISNDRILGPFM